MHSGRCLAGLLSVLSFRTAASCRASRPQPLRTLSKPWLAGMADAGKGKQAKLASFFGGGAKRTAAAAAEDGEAPNNAPGAAIGKHSIQQHWRGVGHAQPALAGHYHFPPRVSGACFPTAASLSVCGLPPNRRRRPCGRSEARQGASSRAPAGSCFVDLLRTVAAALPLTDHVAVTQAFKRLRKAGDAATALQTPAPAAAGAQAPVAPPAGGTPKRAPPIADKSLVAVAAVDPDVDEEGDEDDVSEPDEDAEAAPAKAPAKGKAKAQPKAASKKALGSSLAGVGEKSHAAAAEFTRCDPLKAAEGMWKVRAQL
jgi:hypothetical protein